MSENYCVDPASGKNADECTPEELEQIIYENFPQDNERYPQDEEENEFRYLSPVWINEIAKGLTAGAKKHPGATWKRIPAWEHAWRAIRHLIMFLTGDRSEPHLINASMRVMMAFETNRSKSEKAGGPDGI